MNSQKTLCVAASLALSILSMATAQETLILAPDQFLDELQPLKRFKDATCRPAILLGLTQVYAAYNGADEAEDVKLCIAHYRQTYGVDHVLLVGDIDRFPARYCWWGLINQENWKVSDLYYADLYRNGTTTFDDWDANNNGLYGEIEFAPDGFINNDDIDFLPEVAVGRIPASTEAEVTAYVRKVINYELKTTESAAWFRRAGLYSGDWLSYGNTVLDQIGRWLSSDGFELTKRYFDFAKRQPAPGMRVGIITDLNAGLGFASYVGHGAPDGWFIDTAGLAAFVEDDVALLTNAARLPVIFAAACDTGRYAWFARAHPYVDINGGEHWGTDNGESLPVGAYPHTNLPHPACVQTDGDDNGIRVNNAWYPFDHACIAETLLFGNPVGSGTGAIACVGERSGGQDTAPELNQHFFDAYHKGYRFLGELWNHALRQYYTNHNLGTANTWQRTADQWPDGHVFDEPQKFHLFGDPSLVVGGAFSEALSGTQSDWPWPLIGPLYPLSRHRITGDLTVPAGQRLTAQYYHSFLFENGRKIIAMDTNPSNGFVVNASKNWPVCFLALAGEPQTQNFMRGVRVTAQMRLRNSGALKLYASP